MKLSKQDRIARAEALRKIDEQADCSGHNHPIRPPSVIGIVKDPKTGKSKLTSVPIEVPHE